MDPLSKNIFLLIVLTIIACSLKARAYEDFRPSFLTKEYNEVYLKIKQVRPGVSGLNAHIIAKSIILQSRKHSLESEIFTAILAQESRFKYKMGCHRGKCSDYGISQININTILRYKFDPMRIIFDNNYAIECGALVLKDFKNRYFLVERKWWTRYNTSNPSKRRKYALLVERFL